VQNNPLPALATTQERQTWLEKNSHILLNASESRLDAISSWLLYKENLNKPYSKDNDTLPFDEEFLQNQAHIPSAFNPRIPIDWCHPALSTLKYAKDEINALMIQYHPTSPHYRKLKSISIEISQDARPILNSYIRTLPTAPSIFPTNPEIEDHIDWTNSYHIKHILGHYSKLRQSDQSFFSIEYFDHLIDNSRLESWQLHLIARRIDGAPQITIGVELAQQFGKIFSPSNIPRIMRRIYRQIARTAAKEQRDFADKNNPSKWKLCKECGEIHHVEDFYTGKNECKECTKKRRKQNDKRLRN